MAMPALPAPQMTMFAAESCLPASLSHKRRRHDNGGAVLVVVKDGNIQLFFEPALHLEALGGADVLQVDAAEGGRDHLHRLDDVVRILPGEDDGDAVDARELAEQDRLALHDGQTRQTADVAQPEHGAAVRNDGDGVPFARICIRFFGVFGDLAAGLGDARGICEGEGFLVLDLDERAHLELAAKVRMKL